MNILNRELIEKIAKFIIEVGTSHTMSGNYIFDYDELAKEFGVSEDAVRNSAEDIVDALCEYEEFDYDDDVIHPDCLSCMFYLSYCPNADEEE